MNKKCSGLMALLLCFTVQFSFADLASEIAELKRQKATLESELLPKISEVLKVIFGSIGAVGMFTTYWAASKSYDLLDKSSVGLGYVDYLKYWYGFDKSLAFSVQGKLTEGLIKGLPSKEQGVVENFGVFAPQLGLLSFMFVAMAVALSEKTERYKKEIDRLNLEILVKEKALQAGVQ